MNFDQQPRLPNAPLPIAIIGSGGIVRDAHLPAYSLANFPVMGVYDIDVEKSKDLKEQYPLVKKVYTSLSNLISDAVKVNAIFDLAVPANSICPILEQLPIGSAVLIQKPMGENLKEAEQVLEVCKRRKLVSAINFQLRFAPYMLASKDIIGQGLIGDVFDIEIKVCVHTPWQLWDFLYTKPRVEVLYHSIHYLDLIRSFLGDPIRVMASTLKHPRTKELAATRSSIILDYDQYTQARILTNHGHVYGSEHQESYLKIEGTKGAIKIKIGLSLDYPNGRPPKMEYVILEDGKGWREIPLVGGWFPHAFVGTMAGLQIHYLNREVPLPHSTEDALQTMRLVETVYRSSEEGGINFNQMKKEQHK
ncbi:Gfo/Idh/MocA family protein [Arenibacter certesii]|uniref:Oxidoreductase n=1 Tax=Arenibacter certesii TaxID=228955 RepID=A0A918J4L7_9FLAO|nr:Gfo/Idh/MocA family oxidoreductase [Arenibacter certesii]GGW47793.1 oxidoreductase [Arenibacter certesii]